MESVIKGVGSVKLIYISGSFTWRLPSITVGPAHNTTRKSTSACTSRKERLCGQPNIHQSQFSNSALAKVSYPKRIGPTRMSDFSWEKKVLIRKFGVRAAWCMTFLLIGGCEVIGQSSGNPVLSMKSPSLHLEQGVE